MDEPKEYPFTLSVSDEDLHLLRQRLELVRFPDELDSARWAYGAPLLDVKRLVMRWKDGFNWRKHEADINALPMYTRGVSVSGFGTMDIHYVHQQSEVEAAIPLLFVHGWPGHFLEVRKMLPFLTKASPGCPSFHVVAVSLPGFGFSEAPSKPGFAGPQYAEVLNNLMLSLGYDHYVYQGGDWGHVLGVYTANIYGHRNVMAWHTNCPITTPTLARVVSQPRTALRILALPFNKDDRRKIAATKKHFAIDCGYMIEQATKPQTLGYSLTDSPVGLLAWIYEKLISWSDGYAWSDDEILEWVSIYWFSRAGPAASLRIYHEMTRGNTSDFFRGTRWTSIPTGCSYFAGEVAVLPKSRARLLGNVVYQSEHSKGGHFAAFEQPERLVDDLCKMFGKGGPAYGVVPGKDGYSY